MPVANPLSDQGVTGYSASALGSSKYSSAGATVGGSANLTVGALVGISLMVILAMHLAGFRFAFDVSVGRRS